MGSREHAGDPPLQSEAQTISRALACPSAGPAKTSGRHARARAVYSAGSTDHSSKAQCLGAVWPFQTLPFAGLPCVLAVWCTATRLLHGHLLMCNSLAPCTAPPPPGVAGCQWWDQLAMSKRGPRQSEINETLGCPRRDPSNGMAIAYI